MTDLIVNASVRAVVEFMQARVPAEELCGTVDALGKLAPAIWGHYGHKEVIPLAVVDAARTIVG